MYLCVKQFLEENTLFVRHLEENTGICETFPRKTTTPTDLRDSSRKKIYLTYQRDHS